MLIVCSNCQCKNRLPDSALGKKGKCHACGFIFDIPAEAQEPGTAAASADANPEGTQDVGAGGSDAPTVAAPAPQTIDPEAPVPGAAAAPTQAGPSYPFLTPPQADDELGR